MILAGPIQFTPQEIALLALAALAALLVVTAPGWLAVAVAFRRTGRSACLGAVAGLAVTAAVGLAVVEPAGPTAAVLSAWAACGALAWLHLRRGPA